MIVCNRLEEKKIKKTGNSTMIKSSLQYITLLTVAALISVTGAFGEPPVAHSPPPATINEKDENENYLWEPYSIPEDEECARGNPAKIGHFRK